jgi:hypothetical protein
MYVSSLTATDAPIRAGDDAADDLEANETSQVTESSKFQRAQI